MWDLIKKTDIEFARERLDVRRSEMLSRHAQEREAIDANQTQLTVLNQLAEAFVQKFGISTQSPPAPQPQAAPPISHQSIPGKAAPPPQKHSDRDRPPDRDRPRTNFDTFARAISRG